MKKIWIIILTLILGMIGTVEAGFNDTKIRVENLSNVYGNYLIGNLFYWNQIGIVYANDTVSFCMEPGVWLTENVYDSYTDFSLKDISEKQKQEFERYVYYGYDYPGHQNTRYYLATQELIWRGLGIKEMYWSTGPEHGGEKIDVTKEKNEILALVKKHDQKPSFDGKKYSVTLGSHVAITDFNNVVNRFQISNNAGQQVTIYPTSLYVEPNTVGTHKIELTYHTKTSKTSLLYMKGNSQTLATFGLNDSIKSNVEIEVEGYELTVYKKDYDTKQSTPRGEATLKGAIYGLYQNDQKVAEATSDETGKLVFPNLGQGTYILKEITPSLGYELDTKEYKIIINNTSKAQVSQEVYEKVIENEIEIMKVYAQAETGILTPEKEITFEIYDQEGNLVKEVKTDKQGVAKATLPYGTYLVHQVNTTEGYEKVEDFEIHVTEVKQEPVRYTLSDAKVNARLKINKVDEFNHPIKQKGISFKIKNLDTNQYVKQVITYPKVQEITTFVTDENGEVITPYPLEAGTYQIEEVKSPDGYLPLKEEVIFKIDENSNLQKTETGNIFVISIVNKVPKGQLEIHKQGVGHTLQKVENHFELVESSVPLSNVKFQVTADQDIRVNDSIIYKKGEVVEEIITQDGIGRSKSLPLGNYCIQEVETNPQYQKDNTPYCMSLERDGQKEITTKEFYLQNQKIETELNVLKMGEKMETITGDVGKYQKQPLSGIKFSLFTKEDLILDGEVIKADTKILEGTTDSDGKLKFSGLPLGSYYLQEEKVTSYQPLLNVDVKLENSGQIVTKEIVNQKIKGNILLRKIDKKTKKKIGGAIFKLENVKTGVTYEKRVDETGILKLQDLEYGDYKLTEVEAPNGYMKTKEHYQIKIDGSKNTYTLNISNQALLLPNTSSLKKPIVIFFGVSSALTMISFIILYFMKRHSYE